MALDNLPDNNDKNRRGAVIDMTLHRKRRESQLAWNATGRGGKGGGKLHRSIKLRVATAFQFVSLAFGVAILLRGCGLF